MPVLCHPTENNEILQVVGFCLFVFMNEGRIKENNAFWRIA